MRAAQSRAASSRVGSPFCSASRPTVMISGRSPTSSSARRSARTAGPGGAAGAGAGTIACPTDRAPRERIRSSRSGETPRTQAAPRATTRSSAP